MKVKIINRSTNPLPRYQTAASAGLDLHANLAETIVLKPGDRTLINTGLYMALPEGYEAQIRPRSGLALKHGITVINAPGTIDSDYRGELKVALINHSKIDYEVESGERIAQMIISKFEKIEWETTNELDATDRGSGGYGHTGKNI